MHIVVLQHCCLSLQAWLAWLPQATDGTLTHVAASMLTGLVTTTATAPVDVIKTHMYMHGGRFRGPVHCAAAIVAAEGPGALLKGWVANYARLGPQTLLTFVAVEQMRGVMGMQAM